jgi:prolipoprotein diacylglyceryltransferase
VIGRIGDLAIVEHLGSQTDFFLGFTVKPGYDLSPQHDVLECTVSQAVNGICGTYHHTAFYDMIGAGVLLLVLLWLRKNWTTRHYGQLFAIWVIWYGVQRFFIDFTRLGAAEIGTVADSVMGPFTGSQWGALGGAAIGALLFVRWRRHPVVSAQQDAAYRGESLEPAEGTDLSASEATEDLAPRLGEPDV